MEKVVLKDGTELEIQNGATENTLTMQLTEENTLEKLVATMTEENLAEYKILTESGVECTTVKDKYVKSYTVNTEENTVKFNLADVDIISKRLAELEATQALQDEAITELAEMAAESEVQKMVNFYVYRIQKEKMTLEDVPPKWRDKVAERLEEEN